MGQGDFVKYEILEISPKIPEEAGVNNEADPILITKDNWKITWTIIYIPLSNKVFPATYRALVPASVESIAEESEVIVPEAVHLKSLI